MKTNLETAKRVIEEHFKEANCGIFDCRNWVGDPMVTVYDDAGLTIDICYSYAYFEVFGLSDEDFAELEGFYNSLKFRGGNRMSLDSSKEELKAFMDMAVLKLSVEEYEALIEWAKEQGWGF